MDDKKKVRNARNCKAWRLRNPGKWRAYMREYMRKKRAEGGVD